MCECHSASCCFASQHSILSFQRRFRHPCLAALPAIPPHAEPRGRANTTRMRLPDPAGCHSMSGDASCSQRYTQVELVEPRVDPESLTSSCSLQSKKEMIPVLQMLGSLKRRRDTGTSGRGPTTGGGDGYFTILWQESQTCNGCEI